MLIHIMVIIYNHSVTIYMGLQIDKVYAIFTDKIFKGE